MTENNKKVGMVSLGCPKALVDSERILTDLQLEGYQLVSDYDDADVVIVNTCGFISSAKQESLDTINEAMRENGKVIVTGCMGTDKDAKTIKEANPDILSISGPADVQSVTNAVRTALPINRISGQANNPPHFHPAQGIKLTPRHYAYLKISEGCNHRCSFCIIPSMRGDLVSRPVEDVYAEAEGLAQAGVKELLIVSQDTSAYGVDTKYKLGFINGQAYETRMVALAEALAQLGIWIRLHYVYPYPHVDKVLPLMAAGKILPYLDIPFQHASPKILKLMKRPGNITHLSERIANWRTICPELTIRSTFIVGFPGETEEDFQILLDWLDEAQLDRVGCFKFSDVEGATANLLADPVAEDIKEERWQRFMEKQQKISIAKLQNKIGAIEDVIIDGIDEESDRLIGRTRGDAPEIDGQIFVEADGDFALGDIIRVKVTNADDYDLYGTAL